MFLDTLFVAITTPFRDDDSIDYEAFARHARYLYDSGIPGLFVAGTTGEFDALTSEEKETLLRTAREAFPGIIVANASSTSLKESCRSIALAESLGADAATLLPPYYRSNLSEEGLVQYFNACLNATALPVILYNFSRYTNNPITPELLRRVLPTAIKDSDKNLSLIEDTSCYLCAGDSIIVDALHRGASGVVSVQGNYNPTEIVALWHGVLQNESEIEVLQKKVATTSALFRKNKQIARIKQAVAGVISGYPTAIRVPLDPLSMDEVTEIMSWVKLL